MDSLPGSNKTHQDLHGSLSKAGTGLIPHVAFFLPHLDSGGAERMIAHLAAAFSRLGIRVDVVLCQARGSYLTLLPDTVHVINLGTSSEYSSLPLLVKYLRNKKPDVILSSLTLSTLVMLLSQRISRTNTRTVVRVANTISKQPRSRLKKIFERFLVGWFYRWSTSIIAVSKNVKIDLVDYYRLPSELVQVIYNPGIPLDLVCQAESPVDHPWFGKQNRPVILGVGRLVKAKDFTTLIQAFALVRQDRPTRLVILGSGPEQEELQMCVDTLGLTEDVRFFGYVTNPYAFMQKASVLCLSSIYEGLSNVLIEALACGCPVVSTNCSGGSEEILAGGKYGHLVPVSDPVSMARAILAVLDGDTRKPPSEWLEQFKVEIVVSHYKAAMGINLEPVTKLSESAD